MQGLSSAGSRTGRSGIAEEGSEPFLFEMAVVCEHFVQPFSPHRLHRNAVGQAVSFVGTCTVEPKAGQERLAALRHYANFRAIHEFGDNPARPFPDARSGASKEGQVFGQHFVSRDDQVRTQRPTQFESSGMRRIVDGGQSRPVKGVGENSSQGVLFGTP